MYKCFNKQELLDLINCKLEKRVELEPTYDQLYLNAEEWRDEIGCLSYILSFIIEQKINNLENSKRVINFIYELKDKIFFTLQEIDSDFIDYLIRNLPDPELSLEDNLILIQQGYREYDYKTAIRY